MSSPSNFYELKKQASFFFKEKIKTARLVLTDVTPAQLLTEEATNENPWPPDSPTMKLIAKAAFEIDDYWRIVEILHKRLLKFDAKDWRVSYKALILLEHLLTHGPKSFCKEFQDDKDVIKEMTTFQFIDENGFNWGMRVRILSERILKLLEDSTFFIEERSRARKLTRGIKGFGSFTQRCLSFDTESLNDSTLKQYGSCQETHKDNFKLVQEEDSGYWVSIVSGYTIDDHPFCENEHQTTTSLLSSVD